MSKRKSGRRWRTFWSAFMLTLCLLLLGTGCLVAEYNTRRTAFGDTRLRMDYVYEDGRLTTYTPSEEKAWILPQWVQDWTGRLWILVPARVRAAAWVTEAQQAVAPGFIRWARELHQEWRLEYRG